MNSILDWDKEIDIGKTRIEVVRSIQSRFPGTKEKTIESQYYKKKYPDKYVKKKQEHIIYDSNNNVNIELISKHLYDFYNMKMKECSNHSEITLLINQYTNTLLSETNYHVSIRFREYRENSIFIDISGIYGTVETIRLNRKESGRQLLKDIMNKFISLYLKEYTFDSSIIDMNNIIDIIKKTNRLKNE